MTNFAAVLLQLAALALPLAALGVVAADLSPPPSGLAGRGARRWPPWRWSSADGHSWRCVVARRRRWRWSLQSTFARCRGEGRFPYERTTGRDRLAGEAAIPVPLVLATTPLGRARRRSSATVCRTTCGPSRSSSTCVLAGRSRATLHYVLRPSRRGAFAMEQAFLRVRSRLGLWQRLLDYPAPTHHPRLSRLAAVGPVRPVGPHQSPEPAGRAAHAADRPGPRFRAAPRLHASTTTTSTSTGGRPRGGNNSPSRTIQASQSQRDHLPHGLRADDDQRVGRAEPAGPFAQRHADAQLRGLAAGRPGGHDHFSDEIHSFVPPRGGMRQMNRLLHASFDRFPRLVEIALRPGLPLPGRPLPQAVAGGAW